MAKVIPAGDLVVNPLTNLNQTKGNSSSSVLQGLLNNSINPQANLSQANGLNTSLNSVSNPNTQYWITAPSGVQTSDNLILNPNAPKWVNSNTRVYSGGPASTPNDTEATNYFENGMWVPKSEIQSIFQDMPSYKSSLQNILSGNIPANTSPTDEGALSASEQGAINNLLHMSGFGQFHSKSGAEKYAAALKENMGELGLNNSGNIDWSKYPELYEIMQQDQSQGMNALNKYLATQKANEGSFNNPMEAPKQDQFSITNSLEGNSPKNQIISQYQKNYNTINTKLENDKQAFIDNLNKTQSQVTSELQQLTNPDTLKAFVYGTTGNSILGSLYNQVKAGRLPLSDYEQMAHTFTTVAANNVKFINSYNNLFKNFLNLNINLNDQINALKSMVSSLHFESPPPPTQDEINSGLTSYLENQGMSPFEAQQTINTNPGIGSDYATYFANIGA